MLSNDLWFHTVLLDFLQSPSLPAVLLWSRIHTDLLVATVINIRLPVSHLNRHFCFLGVFLFLVSTLNSVSLIMATLVMNIKKRADRRPCGKVPPWLLWLSERVLRKFTITRLSDWQHAITSCDEPSSSASPEPQESPSDSISQESDIENALKLETIGPSDDHRLQKDHPIQRSLLRTRSYKISCIRDKKDFVCLNDTLSVSNRHLRYEWMFVAEVVDKFSFFVYVVVMSVTVMTTLILVPSFTWIEGQGRALRLLKVKLCFTAFRFLGYIRYICFHVIIPCPVIDVLHCGLFH